MQRYLICRISIQCVGGEGGRVNEEVVVVIVIDVRELHKFKKMEILLKS